MNYKFLATFGFIMFFQLIQIGFGQELGFSCEVVSDERVSDGKEYNFVSCFWTNRDTSSCEAAKDYLQRLLKCKVSYQNYCLPSVGKCERGLGYFQARCKDIGGKYLKKAGTGGTAFGQCKKPNYLSARPTNIPAKLIEGKESILKDSPTVAGQEKKTQCKLEEQKRKRKQKKAEDKIWKGLKGKEDCQNRRQIARG